MNTFLRGNGMHLGPSRGGLNFSSHASTMGDDLGSLAINRTTAAAITIEYDSPIFPQMLLYKRLMHSRLILLES